MGLSLDEKTQIQALDRTQPLLPIEFDASEKRSHDYVRHGTTNLFAALNVGTGEVFVHFHFTPKGSSWMNQIETWFGIATRQSIRRGTFTSVKVLITQIHDYITHWNSDAKPFVWTATAEEVPAKVRLSKPTSRNSPITTLSKDNRITRHEQTHG